MMKYLFIVLLFLSATYAREDSSKNTTHILELQGADFYDTINEYKYSLVLFSSRWSYNFEGCGPEFDRAGDLLEESNPEVKLFKVRASSNDHNSETYFNSYDECPIRLFIMGVRTPLSYENDMIASSIASWVGKMEKYLTSEVESIGEMEQIKDENEVVALFLGSGKSESYMNVLNSVSSPKSQRNTMYDPDSGDDDDTVFVYSNNVAIKQEFANECSDKALVVFDKFNDTQEVFCGSFSDSQKIREFIRSINALTRILRSSWGNGLRSVHIERQTTPLLFLLRRGDDEGILAEKVFRDAVKTLRGKFILTVFIKEDSYNDGADEFFSISARDLPLVRILDPSQNMRKYAFDKKLSVGNIKKFGEDFLAKKLSPYYLSQPLPIDSEQNGVYVVVGNTFEEVVLNEENDVLIVGYSNPKKSDQTVRLLESMATTLKDVKHFIIARINTQFNELEGAGGSPGESYPMIRFYPRGQKNQPVQYDMAEARVSLNLKTLTNFIKKCAILKSSNPESSSGSNKGESDIVSWVAKTLKVPSSAIKSTSDAEKLIEGNNVIGFFFGSPSSESFSQCLDAVLTFEDITFAYSDEKGVKDLYAVNEEMFVLFDRSGEARENFTIATQKSMKLQRDYGYYNDYDYYGYAYDYYGYANRTTFTMQAVQSFIKSTTIFSQMIQVIRLEGWGSAQTYANSTNSTLFFVREQSLQAGDQAEDAFRAAAENYRSEISVRIFELDERHYQEEFLKFYNFTNYDLPVIRIMDSKHGKRRYIYDGDFSEHSIQNFMDDYKAGKISPFYISQPVPINSTENNVTVVVGSTFNEIVMDEQKDVFILGYHPPAHYWIGIGALEALAGKLEDKEDIVVAKIDTSSNEFGGEMISSSPYIRLYLKGSKDKPVEFYGERSIEGYIWFLRQYVSGI